MLKPNTYKNTYKRGMHLCGGAQRWHMQQQVIREDE